MFASTLPRIPPMMPPGMQGFRREKEISLFFQWKKRESAAAGRKSRRLSDCIWGCERDGKKGKIEKQNSTAAQSHCSYQRGKKYSGDREYRKFHQKFLLYVSRIFAALYKIRMEKLIFSRKTGILFKHHAPHTEPRSAGTKRIGFVQGRGCREDNMTQGWWWTEAGSEQYWLHEPDVGKVLFSLEAQLPEYHRQNRKIHWAVRLQFQKRITKNHPPKTKCSSLDIFPERRSVILWKDFLATWLFWSGGLSCI